MSEGNFSSDRDIVKKEDVEFLEIPEQRELIKDNDLI
jgi:hypothetical protein